MLTVPSWTNRLTEDIITLNLDPSSTLVRPFELCLVGVPDQRIIDYICLSDFAITNVNVIYVDYMYVVMLPCL